MTGRRADRWLATGLLIGTLLWTFDGRAEPDAGASVGAESSKPGAGPLVVVFEESAASLPQPEIRAAIEKELGRPVLASGSAGASELSIGTDSERGLVVRYRTSRGAVERYLPMPSRAEDVALIVSLAAGNLARDQTLTPTDPATPAKAPVEPTANEPPPKTAMRDTALDPYASPTPTPPFKRHWLGLHVAQDLAVVGASNVCDPTLGQATDNYTCFREGTTDQPYFGTPFPYRDEVDTQIVLATTRLLFSYDFALAPIFSIGTRVGWAFGGGPPAGQAPSQTEGVRTDGVAFLPIHLEARVSLWFLSLSNERVRAYAGAGFGVAQVDAKVEIAEKDCTRDAALGYPGSAEEALIACRNGSSDFDWPRLPDTRVDAWKKLGQGFVAANLGAMLAFSESWGAVANLNLMLMLPARGLVIQPSLGVALAL